MVQEKPKRRGFSVLLNDLQYHWIIDRAATRDISAAQVIREAITEYRDRKESKTEDEKKLENQ